MAKSAKNVGNFEKTDNMPEKQKPSNEATTRLRSALSGWPMILAWLAMLIFAFHSSTHMVGAGDTWVAMACGRHFLNHGVDTVEPFSANSHTAGPTEKEIANWPAWAQSLAEKFGMETVKKWHPTGWVNQNWLTHVIFYWLTHESPIADSGEFPPAFNQLVYWKIAIYILSVICIYYTARLLSVNPALSAVFACFAMFIGRSYFDVRPAGFSNLLVAVFLLILVLTTYRNIFYIWLIVPLTAFWCNVHGGYLYLFIMLVPFVALNLLTCLSRQRFTSIGLKGVVHTMAAGFAAFIAMIIFNPFHLTNLTHTFVISVSKHAEMWRSVNEWHPACEWSNPVGTGFPFLVMFVLSIGLPLLWLLSRFLKPRLLKAPKNELLAQKKMFDNLTKIFVCIAAITIGLATLISLSMLNVDFAGPDGAWATDDDSIDFASVLLCALFVCILLLAVLKNIHFIYIAIPLSLFALWSGGKLPGYAGRYIYPFIIVPAFVITAILTSLFSKKVKIKPVGILFVVITALVALILMTAIFNPFKFKLTPFPAESGRGFWSSVTSLFSSTWVLLKRVVDSLTSLGQWRTLRRIWRPPYERPPIAYKHFFSGLFIANITSVVVWLNVPYLKNLFSQIPQKNEDRLPPAYQLPKINLALIVIAALTVYMAIRSRRFIPIAGFVACPVLAMFIDQMARTISAARNFHQKNRLVVSPMPRILQWAFIICAFAAVIGFGSWWGLKFKYIYLDNWHNDPALNSAFMRMTASDAKPFYACKFIKDNKLSGKMFNYWTEGGFIAYGQQPDPNTGKTPLQLFMDGRAQAAYEPRAYQVWSDIMAGGPIVRASKVNKRPLSAADYPKVGKWVSESLRRHRVWIVLMPAGQFDTPFVKGLENSGEWPIVFLNNKQKMFVDIKTTQGKKLFDGISSGQTVYPHDHFNKDISPFSFSKNLILAHYLLAPTRDQKAHRQGYEFAVKAFRQHPSQAAMQKIVYAARYPELTPLVYELCKTYFEDFSRNQDTYSKRDSYYHILIAALNTGHYLRAIANRQNNSELAKHYENEMRRFESDRKRLVAGKRW